MSHESQHTIIILLAFKGSLSSCDLSFLVRRLPVILQVVTTIKSSIMLIR